MRIIAVIAALRAVAVGPASAQDAQDAARQSHLELAGARGEASAKQGRRTVSILMA